MKTDFTIIGSGAIGLSLAWELARRGHSVCVVDRGQIAEGASWTATGILPPANLKTATDPIDRLRGLSHSLYPDWTRDLKTATGIDCELLQSGGWYLADSPGEIGAMIGMQEYWRELEIECRRVDLDELGKREPKLSDWAKKPNRSGDRAAWFAPNEYQIRSPRFLAALEKATENLGVRFLPFHQVDDLQETSDGVTVFGNVYRSRNGEKASCTADSRFEINASQVVVCAGTWTGRVAQTLGLAESFVPVRGQILALRSPQRVFNSVVNLGHRYCVSRRDGVTLVGSCEEEVGFQHGTTPEALRDLRDFAKQFGSALSGATEIQAWSGLRPMTFDGFPAIGKVPDLEHIFVAAGHFRSGLHLAPGTAVTLADCISGATPIIDLDDFRISNQRHPAQNHD